MNRARAPDGPAEAVKGAWGGAWTVAYGCLAFLKALAGAAGIEMLVRGARLGAAVLRAEAMRAETADVAGQVAALLDRMPAAFGVAQRPWIWAAGGLGALAAFAGLGVIRGSEGLRRTAIAAVAASALLAVGLTTHFAVVVLPPYVAWVGDAREILRDLERQGASIGPGIAAVLQADRAHALAWEAALLLVHLGFAGLLIARLAGRKTRSWCDLGGRGALAGSGPRG